MVTRLGSESIDAAVLAADGNGLGAVRSLGRRGLSVATIGHSATDVSLHSRYPKQKYCLTAQGEADKEEQLLVILEKLRGNDIVLIPTSDWFVTMVSKHKGELSGRFKFCLPPREIADLMIDKARETEKVSGIVPIPKTVRVLPDTPDEFLSMLSLPIIVKPRSHEHMVLGKKNVQLFSREEVEAFYRKFGAVKDRVIAQEIIEGEDGLQCVCNCFFDENSNLLQAFTFQRLRLSPSHYGVTSYALSGYNQEVIERTATLGKQLGYVGPAMAEFKLDRRDGMYKFLELNPRLGMCNYFDTVCGVDNVYATYLLAKGEKPAPSNGMKSGVVFLSLYEDFYSRRRDGEKPVGILKDYLSNATKPHVFMYFTWRDPMPAIMHGLRLSKAVTKSLIRKLHGVITRR
jgi:D-aspartate ligase